MENFYYWSFGFIWGVMLTFIWFRFSKYFRHPVEKPSVSKNEANENVYINHNDIYLNEGEEYCNWSDTD